MSVVDIRTGELIRTDDWLRRVEKMTRDVERIATTQDAINVINFCEAARVFAREMKLGIGAMNHATTIKLRAARRLADVTDQGQANGTIAAAGQPRSIIGPTNNTPPASLRDLNIDPRSLHDSRIIRDNYTDEDIVALAEDATEDGKQLVAGKLVSAVKQREKELQRDEHAAEAAAARPITPNITLASWNHWLPTQPDCDLLLTDPPYSTDIPDIVRFANDWVPVALNKVKPTGRAYICIGAYPIELAAYLTVPTPEHMLLSQVLVWTYRNTLGPSPTHDYKLNWQAILYYRGADAPKLDCPEMLEQFSVQDINAPDGRQGDRWHAWQKPDTLAARFVRHASAKNDLILDPFAGTGTFLIAAGALERQARGCEVEPDMVDIAEKRGCRRAE